MKLNIVGLCVVALVATGEHASSRAGAQERDEAPPVSIVSAPRRSLSPGAYAPTTRFVGTLGSGGLRHGGLRVFDLAFSPDGRVLASAGDSGVRIWNADDGSLVRRLAAPNADEVFFSPDGALIAANLGSYPSPSIAMWRVTDGGTFSSLAGAQAIGFMGDGRMVIAPTNASGRGLGPAVWEPRPGNDTVMPIEGASDDRFRFTLDAAITPSGRQLFACADDYAVVVQEPGRESPVLALPALTTEYGVRERRVMFSPDGRWLFSNELTATFSVHALEDPRRSRSFPGEGNVVAVDATGCGLVALGRFDGKVEVWDPSVGHPVTSVASSGRPCAIALSHDGSRLATAASDQSLIRLWRLSDGTELRPAYGHSTAVRHMVGQGGGDLLQTLAADGLYRFDVASGRIVARAQTADLAPLALAPNGELVAVRPRGSGSVTVLDSELREVATLGPDEGNDLVATAFSPDGLQFAASTWRKTYVWEVGTWRHLATHDVGTSAGTLAFASSEALVVAGHSNTFLLHSTRGERREIGRDLAGDRRALRVSPDGHGFARCTENDGVEFREIETGRITRKLRPHSRHVVQNAAFSPDGGLLASGGCGDYGDGSVRLYDVATGQELDSIDLSPSRDHATELAFLSDRRLAVGTARGLIHVFDIGGTAPNLIANPAPASSDDVETRMVLGGTGICADTEDSPGWNVPRPLLDQDRGRNELYLQVQPEVSIRLPYLPSDGREEHARARSGARVLLVNDRDEAVTFDAAAGRLYMVQEAQDEAGAWRPIERMETYTCGSAYHSVRLGEREFWELSVRRYRGPFLTKLRVSLTIDHGKGGQRIISNEFPGGIHPEQFTAPRR